MLNMMDKQIFNAFCSERGEMLQMPKVNDIPFWQLHLCLKVKPKHKLQAEHSVYMYSHQDI